MRRNYRLNGRLYHVAAEHGRRGGADHLLTLVESPDNKPVVISIRESQLELAGFIVEETNDQDMAA